MALEFDDRVIVAFDELQEARMLVNLPYLLAYIYDNFKGITVIATGSEVGVVYDVLRLEDSESPLYRRAIGEVRLRRLSREESAEFLSEGFDQLSVSVSRSLIDEIIDHVDGIIGWLTYYGWSIAVQRERDLSRIREMASLQAVAEVRRFLERSRERYYHILKAIALGLNRWSEVKGYLEAKEGMEIDDSTFNTLLKTLVKLGFVERKDGGYLIADPLVAYAVRRKL